MESYRRTVRLAADPNSITVALTTPDGILGWWSDACEFMEAGEPEFTIRFGRTYNIMRIVENAPGREVVWRCMHQFHALPGSDRTDEWRDTTLRFRVTPQEDGQAQLDFVHEGLVRDMDCYDVCEAGWDHFLRSLKSFLETGAGSPFSTADHQAQ